MKHGMHKMPNGKMMSGKDMPYDADMKKQVLKMRAIKKKSSKV